MKKKVKIALLTVVLLFFTFVIERFAFIRIDTTNNSYTDYANTKHDERGKLLGYEFVGSIASEDINGLFPEIDENVGDISELPQYDIKLYRINYSSVFLYDIVTLSGLIVVPQKEGQLSHLQYHHGTLYPFYDKPAQTPLDAPSLYKAIYPESQYDHYETRLFGNYLGSFGYLVSLPDYIGYGASADYEHTYSVNIRLAEQSVDMILATREFCTVESIPLNGKLFLSGWSEGGAATLATQRLIEASYRDKITITANAALASFSSKLFYSKFLLGLAPLAFWDFGSALNDLLWATYAINRYTDNEPLETNKIFKFEVNNQNDVLQNRPTSTPSKAIRYFIQDRDKLISKFAQNDLSDGWKPIAPIYIHHGTKDTDVFYYFNAEPTVNNLNKMGGDVELVKYTGHDHESLDKLYLLNMIEAFSQY